MTSRARAFAMAAMLIRFGAVGFTKPPDEPALTMSIRSKGTTGYALAARAGGFGGCWREIRGKSFTLETRLTWKCSGTLGVYTRAQYGFMVEDATNGIIYFIGPGQGTGPDYDKRADSAGFTRIDRGRQNWGRSGRTGLEHVYKAAGYRQRGEWLTAYLRLRYDAATRTFFFAASPNGKNWRDRFTWQEKESAFRPTRVGLSLTCTWDADPKTPLVQRVGFLRSWVEGVSQLTDDFTDASQTMRNWRLVEGGVSDMRIDLTGRKRPPPAQRDFPAPLWRLPPISNPYFIVWYGAPSPSVQGSQRLLTFSTQTVETLASDPRWWLGREIWPFGWSWGTQGPYKSADDYYEYIVGLIEKNAYGVCFDEWVGTDTVEDVRAYFDSDLPAGVRKHAEQFWKKDRGNPRNLMLAEACRRIKEEYSPFFIAAYTHMQSQALVKALREGWVDLAIVEAYTYVPGEPDWTPELAHWRLNNAKKAGVLEKTIPALYVSARKDKRGFRMTEAAVEKEIQYYRREFPQMPGICFYCASSAARTFDAQQRSLLRACDRLAAKYYLDPAPKVRLVAPVDGAQVHLPMRIEAEADKPVKTWRLYVGAKHVCDQASNVFTVTDLAPGPNVITVQAITSDFLRGVEQVEIEVVESSK